MAVTPLIKPVQDKKGIFYNFQSALEDINITLANTENAVRFSKFALLRIPEIGTPDTLATDNKRLPKSYIEQLSKANEVTKQRLLYGNFDYDDSP
jgi:hypothetical protein